MVKFKFRDGEKSFKNLSEITSPGQHSMCESLAQSIRTAAEAHPCPKCKFDSQVTVEIDCADNGPYHCEIISRCHQEFEDNIKKGARQAFPSP